MFIPKFSRRQFLKGLGISGGIVILSPISSFHGIAATRPCPQIAGKRIRWVVPYSPGGGFDTYSRLIAPFFQKRIGAMIKVENVPGGGGVLGALLIKKAAPDGLTLGIVNTPGLLVASLAGEARVPNPARDFTILGRVSRSRRVLVVAGHSSMKTMDDIFEVAQSRSILFAITEVGSTSFMTIAVLASLLDVPSEYVAGYPGSREASMAVIRGEVDIVNIPFDGAIDRIEAGDLRPILQVSSERISPHPALDGVALLGGKGGVTAQRAEIIGRDIEKTKADVKTLLDLVDSGRHVVAPLGLNESLFGCLEYSLYQALTDSAFRAAAADAKLSLQVARGHESRADILTGMEKAKKFLVIFKKAIQEVRK